MNLNIFKLFPEMIKNQNKYPFPHTNITFKALVDAAIPKTPKLAENHGPIQLFGALDCNIHGYEIWILNHFVSLHIPPLDVNIYLSNSTAKMLDVAARQLIDSKENKKSIDSKLFREKYIFASLEPEDRFRAITLLEELKINPAYLPLPFYNNPGLIVSLTGGIVMFITIGYYTEWSAYGSTSMETPNKRKLEQFPIGWEQVGYPGPSKGYHAFRGYL
ncbi:hypothetical protein [Clostridium sp. BJN0013]|uniref:hypothetical protein n=1 Tax=Clostridium sp. BJN0013 TaxID=3236840 RepID=UPI0034C6575F